MSFIQKLGAWGKTKLAAIIVAIATTGIFAWVKYEAIPTAANTVFEIARDEYGMDITVDKWALDFSSSTLSANNLSWNIAGRYSTPEILRISSISINLNIWSAVWAALHKDFNLMKEINNIEITAPRITLEHKNSDQWNWENIFETQNVLAEIQRISHQNNLEEDLNFDISKIHLSNMTIIWIEELVANSGQGKTQHLRSELHIDDGELLIHNVTGFMQKNNRSMRIEFDARTADGLIKASGKISPFLVSEAHKPDNTSTELAWTPKIQDLTIYVENVNASAFGEMVPDSLLKPSGGTMTGKIFINIGKDKIANYETEIEYSEVQWTLNEYSSQYKKSSAQGAKKALTNYSKTGKIITESKGRIGDENFRLIPSIQTAMTREAVQSAPSVVKKAASRDQIRYEDKEVSPVVAKLDKVHNKLMKVEKTVNKANKVKKTFDSVTKTFKGLFH